MAQVPHVDVLGEVLVHVNPEAQLAMAGQLEQLVAPATEYVPAPQALHIDAVLAAEVKVPAGQAVQVVLLDEEQAWLA
jgi:hypothetical protein